jgi:hypothetical protein
MEINEINEIVLIVDNIPGSLYKISSAISSSGLNIEAINSYAKDAKTAVFRIITSDPETAKKIIGKAGLAWRSLDISKVLIVKMMDRPGELTKLTEKLYKNKVDIETLYIIDKANGYTEVVLKTQMDHGKLKKILGG